MSPLGKTALPAPCLSPASFRSPSYSCSSQHTAGATKRHSLNLDNTSTPPQHDVNHLPRMWGSRTVGPLGLTPSVLPSPLDPSDSVSDMVAQSDRRGLKLAGKSAPQKKKKRKKNQIRQTKTCAIQASHCACVAFPVAVVTIRPGPDSGSCFRPARALPPTP